MKNSRRKRWGSILMALLAMGILSVFAFNFYAQEQRLTALREEKRELEEQRDALTVEKQRLDRLYEYTKTDDYVEQYVRERLGWVRDGEIVFHLPEESELPQ